MQGMRKNTKMEDGAASSSADSPDADVSFAAFGAEEAAAKWFQRSGGIRNDMGASAADRGNWAGLDYQGGIQLFVCGNFSRFYSVFRNNFEVAVTHMFENGVIGVLSDSYNVGILVFLVILGAMVGLMNRAGGSAAFGQFASKRIKSRVGAQPVYDSSGRGDFY